MSTGVGVNQACQKAYQSLKLDKKDKYIIFAVNKEKTEIVVEKTSGSTNYEEFLKDLPDDHPRWAVYDFHYEVADGKRNKLVFISWNPEKGNIREKMIFAGSKDALRRSLDGISVDIQGTDADEVSWDTILEKAKKGTR